MLIPMKKKLFFSMEDRVSYWLPEIELILFKLTIPAGQTKLVYKPQDGDGLTDHLDGSDIGTTETVTIVPPGGSVLIHSPMLDAPGAWEGSLEQTGYGLIMKAEFHYEAIVDSEWRCLGPRMQQPLPDGIVLSRKILEPGEAFTFDDGTLGIVSMWGAADFEGFVGEPGDTFVADTRTLLAVCEVHHV